MKQLLLLLLPAAATGGCQKPDVTPEAPAAPVLTHGQIVRAQVTYTYNGSVQPLPPRFRWIVQLDAPLTLPGAGNVAYSAVKTFSLSDTATYRTGARIAFTYQLVPQAQQTPGRSQYEWLSAAPSPGYIRHPELTLGAVQVE